MFNNTFKTCLITNYYLRILIKRNNKVKLYSALISFKLILKKLVPPV